MSAYVDERRLKKRPAARPVHARPLHYLLRGIWMMMRDEDDSDDDRRTPMTRDTDDQEKKQACCESPAVTQHPPACQSRLTCRRLLPKRESQVTKRRRQSQRARDLCTPSHKGAFDLIQKTSGTRELELSCQHLPRDSKFQERARTELHFRQRAKYDKAKRRLLQSSTTPKSRTDTMELSDKAVSHLRIHPSSLHSAVTTQAQATKVKEADGVRGARSRTGRSKGR